jgi:hypothetical protein
MLALVGLGIVACGAILIPLSRSDDERVADILEAADEWATVVEVGRDTFPVQRIVRSIEGRVAVFAGAGSGIGRATCEALPRRGATIAVVDISTPRATETGELAVRLVARPDAP